MQTIEHHTPKREYLNIKQFGDRLRHAIQPMSQKDFAQHWGGSVMSINNYVQGKRYPSINVIVEFAQLTNTDFLWLLTGEHYTQTPWLKSNQFVATCPDHSMAPTLMSQSPIIVDLIENEAHFNGVYLIRTLTGDSFRRLQWSEKRQSYRVLCDNPLFKTDFDRHPFVIGKVCSALQAVI